VSPDNPQELAKSVIKILLNLELRKLFSINAKKFAHTFSSRIIADTWEKEINKLLD